MPNDGLGPDFHQHFAEDISGLVLQGCQPTTTHGVNYFKLRGHIAERLQLAHKEVCGFGEGTSASVARYVEGLDEFGVVIFGLEMKGIR